MDVEVRHLRAFVAVAHLQSYTAASRQLFLTQPAVTRTVQQLERRLDVRLLDRSSRSVKLTADGLAFLQRARAILRDLDRAVAEATGARALRIGFSWVLPEPWISDVISAFEEATGASARLKRRDDINAALERGDIDVALTRHQLTLGDLTTIPLVDEPRVAAVSSRWPLSERMRVSWNELSTYPLVINTVNGSTQVDMWESAHRPVDVVECDNYDEWATLVSAGRGVGSIACSAATASTRSSIVYLPLDDAPTSTLRLSYLASAPGALLRHFVEVATKNS